MEENIFARSSRASIPRIRIESAHSYTETESFFDKMSTVFISVSIVVQLVLGVLGSSLTLVADAARVFADHLEQFHFNRNLPTGKRLTEIIAVGITAIVLFLLSIVFILLASARAATMDFDVNRLFLIAGTVVSMTSNSVQTMQHFRTWKHESNYDSTLHINSRLNQIIHGIGYHFIAYFVVCSSLLIVATKEYLIADVVTAYIASLLIMCNLASIGFRLYREYFSLEHPQDEYEPL